MAFKYKLLVCIFVITAAITGICVAEGRANSGGRKVNSYRYPPLTSESMDIKHKSRDIFTLGASSSQEKKVSCTPGLVKHDNCGRKCYCEYPGCWKCCRIRRDFRDMEEESRKRYVETIKTASTNVLYKAAYDALIKEHIDLFRNGIHEKDHFLPWHRDYILRYENLMRQIDCRFTVPYWDWSRDGNPWDGLPWWGIWPFFDYKDRLGPGNYADRCVTKGPFKFPEWTLTPSAGNSCLRRSFEGFPPDTVAVMELLTKLPHQFTDFEEELRYIFHDSVHCMIGGTMCTRHAANAPEFFLHHAFIDKIWEDWQKKGSSYRFAHFPWVGGFMPGTSHFPKDLLRLDKQPGDVCVQYHVAPAMKKVLNYLRGRKLNDLRSICNRRFLSPVSQKAMQLFRVSVEGKRKIRRAEKRFSPRICKPPKRKYE